MVVKLMYKDLGHLTQKQLKSLMDRYYSGESVKDLISSFQLDVRPTNLFRLFPPEEHENYLCDYCNTILVTRRPSKTYKDLPIYEQDLYCPACDHKPYVSPPCKCDNCSEVEKNLEEYLNNLIRRIYSEPTPQINFSDISFLSKVYLGALCRALIKENLYEVSPYSDAHMPLAPNDELKKEIYSLLKHDNVIKVSPTSPISAFDIEAEDFPNIYYIYKVTYELNLVFPPNKQQLFDNILNPTYYNKELQEDALLLWKKIAVAECVEYLIYQLTNVGFKFSPGEKTFKTFEIILDDFSVSQIYGIIWKAVADASKLYLEKGMSKQHAANTTISACERYSERAKINGWNLTEYSRIKDLPQSTLSLFFFNRVLGIGDMGFIIPPTIV